MSRSRRQQKKRARQWVLTESKTGRLSYRRGSAIIPVSLPRWSLSEGRLK